MFDLTHYIPILKPKAGELWALRFLESNCREKITPLFEIHRPVKRKDAAPKPLDKHVDEVFDSIKNCWGSSFPFFLDTEWINSAHGTSSAMSLALDACRKRGLKVIPVVKLGYDDAALKVVKSAIGKDNRGVLLRLDFEDVHAKPAIRGITEILGVQLSDAHLLLDYRDQPVKLAEDIHLIPSLREWQTFTTSSAAFPKTISTLPKRTWNPIPRHDWNAWEQLIVRGDLPREAIYSDYATRCSGPPASGGDAIVHLRYTRQREWIVYLDGRQRSGDAPKMRTICRNLIKRRDYDKPEFSEGDKEISVIAHQDKKSGGAREWVQWCLNHHLTFVVNQLETFAAI